MSFSDIADFLAKNENLLSAINILGIFIYTIALIILVPQRKVMKRCDDLEREIKNLKIGNENRGGHSPSKWMDHQFFHAIKFYINNECLWTQGGDCSQLDNVKRRIIGNMLRVKFSYWYCG